MLNSYALRYLPLLNQRTSIDLSQRFSDLRKRTKTDQTPSPFQSYATLPHIFMQAHKQQNTSTPKSNVPFPPRISIGHLPPIVKVIQGTPEPCDNKEDKLKFAGVVDKAMRNKARLTNKTKVVNIEAV